MLRTSALWLSGGIGCVLVLELLCRVLPVSTSTETDYYTDPLVVTYPPHHRWTLSTGWDLRNAQQLQANNAGYAATRDFLVNDQAVALVGDSFVEASMLPAPERPAAQLERALKARPVYAMGSPGTALLDYAERIRFAHTHWGVRDFVVVMERGDVLQSLCGSGNVHGPCLDPITLAPRTATLPPAGAAKRWLRHSALAQYLVSQLKLSPQKLQQLALAPAHASPAPAPAVSASATAPTVFPKVDAVAQTFFERIKPHVTGRLVIVLDCDRTALQRGQLKPDPARAHFMALARDAGALVVDTEPLYRAHLQHSSLKLDVGPYDGHLNALGVRLSMQAAATTLLQP